MENVKEKQLKKVPEVWEEIFENIGVENFSMIVKILEKQLNRKSEEPFNEPFREIEFPYNKRVTPDITLGDINNLKYSEEINEVDRTFRLHFREDQYGIKGHINVKSQKIDVTIHLSPKKKREFLKKYNKEKSLLCKGYITYNVDLERFSVFNLEIYKISDPFEKWKNLMMDKKLKERFDILLTILRLKPDALSYHEKLMPVVRLIPLVVKKTFMVEISTKGIGKTHSYQSLGFNLYNTDVTKATAFVDGRNKKGGDFFYETITYIIDEFHKVKQAEEIITPIQLYMSGDNKYEGIIQISMEDKRITDISPIILANAKIDTPLLYLFVNNQGQNCKPISLFDNTSILSSPDGTAFISRINLLPNSWGCRIFSSSMKSEEIDFYNIELLKEVIPVLRNKEFDIKRFYETTGINISNTNIRGSESVEKNFEGLIKLLFPELLDNLNQYEMSKHFDELKFLFERAMELRKTIENQLKIINPSDNTDEPLPYITSSLKNAMFNITGNHIFTAHRVFIDCQNGKVKKIALDLMGIELNGREAKVLEKNGRKYDLKEITLVHSLGDNRSNLYKSEANWENNFYEKFFSQQNSLLNFNFLIGEIELIDKDYWELFQLLSFYDLI